MKIYNMFLLIIILFLTANCNLLTSLLVTNGTNIYPHYEIYNNFNSDFGSIKIGSYSINEIFIYGGEEIGDNWTSTVYASYDWCDLKVSTITSDNPDNFSIDISGLEKDIDDEKTTSFKVIFHPVAAGEIITTITIKFSITDPYDGRKTSEYYTFILKGTGIN